MVHTETGGIILKTEPTGMGGFNNECAIIGGHSGYQMFVHIHPTSQIGRDQPHLGGVKHKAVVKHAPDFFKNGVEVIQR